MKILLIDNGTKHLGKLKKLLAGNEIEVHPLFQKYPATQNYDLIILSGGSQIAVVSAPEVFQEEINLIRNCEVPLIGICEGCEIIAHAFNSELEFVDFKIKGIKEVEIINKDYFDFNSPFKVFEAHHWAIKKLSPSLIGIAKSKYGYEIIKNRVKPMYGLQFHPEMFVDTTLGDDLFKTLIRSFNIHAL